MQEITIINLGGMLGYGANCYLIKADTGYILIDTGFSPKRVVIENS
jgi:mRNA degradation ribonuclease J1/J2